MILASLRTISSLFELLYRSSNCNVKNRQAVLAKEKLLVHSYKRPQCEKALRFRINHILDKKVDVFVLIIHFWNIVPYIRGIFQKNNISYSPEENCHESQWGLLCFIMRTFHFFNEFYIYFYSILFISYIDWQKNKRNS